MNDFPLWVFPRWFSDMVKAVSNKWQTPEVVAANFGLSIISALLALRVYVYYDENTQPTNLWTMTLLPAGEGKSPVLKEMAKPLNNTNLAVHKVEDITVSAMCRKMKSLKKLFVLSAEGTFFDNFLRERGQSSTILMKSYDEESFSYQRGNNVDIKIENPSLTLGLALQNDRFKQYQSERVFQKAVANGLLDRFLPAVPESMVGRRRFSINNIVPCDTWDTYCDSLRALNYRYAWTSSEIDDVNAQQGEENNSFETQAVGSVTSENHNVASDNNSNDKIILEVSHDAMITFNDWRNRMEADFNNPRYKPISQWMGKMSGFVLRIAGILHIMDEAEPYFYKILDEDENNPLSDDKHKISEKQINRAIQLVEYYRNERLRLTGEKHSFAEKILGYMKRKNKTEIKKYRLRNALKGTAGLKSKEDFEVALLQLEEEGKISVTSSDVKIVE